MVDRLSPESSQVFPISATQKNINEIIAYIHKHIYDNLTVTELANHFYLHPDYLSRLFKKHAHTSVSHYITLQKISAEHLTETAVKLSDLNQIQITRACLKLLRKKVRFQTLSSLFQMAFLHLLPTTMVL